MVELSKKLSHGYPFVRIDFFDTPEKLFVAEMTFYPGGGQTLYYPASDNEEMEKCLYYQYATNTNMERAKLNNQRNSSVELLKVIGMVIILGCIFAIALPQLSSLTPLFLSKAYSDFVIKLINKPQVRLVQGYSFYFLLGHYLSKKRNF